MLDNRNIVTCLEEQVTLLGNLYKIQVQQNKSLSTKVELLEAELKNLKNSKSWRYTELLRNLYYNLLRYKPFLRPVYRYCIGIISRIYNRVVFIIGRLRNIYLNWI